jgi:hypothetical protein
MARARAMTTLVMAVLLCEFGAAGQQQAANHVAEQTIELDNADIRAHRLILGEGAAAAIDHMESVVVFVRGDRARITPEGDPDSASRSWQGGNAVIVRGGRHNVENVGRGSVEIVWVELKKPGSSAYRGMPRDPVKVDPARHSLVVENEHVRVLRQVAVVGETGPPHDHPSYLRVRISGITPNGIGPGGIEWTDGPFTHGGIPAAQALNAIIIEPKSGSGATPKRLPDNDLR